MTLIAAASLIAAGLAGPACAAAAAPEHEASPEAHSPPSEPVVRAVPGGEPKVAAPRKAILLPSDLLPPSRYVKPPGGSGDPGADGRDEEFRRLQEQLLSGRELRLAGRADAARSTLIPLLESLAPAEIQEQALLELGLLSEQQKEFSRAQQIYNQWMKHFPDSPSGPEVLLRQGLMYREMGAPTLAIAKFYAVGSTALHLKEGNVTNYQRVVLQAQTEIAQTHFLQGKYTEAAEFLNRLLRQETGDLQRALIRHKLILCLERMGSDSELEGAAREFIRMHPGVPEAPEVRFILANALKRMNRPRDALAEINALLVSQQKLAPKDRAAWRFWQQRVGNEIANQLYQEGDYVNALSIYEGLLPLDPSFDWQLPLLYQIGLVYERLEQPPRAEQAYRSLILKAGEGATNVTSVLRPVVEMARWRAGQLQWQDKARRTNSFFGGTVRQGARADAGGSPPPSPESNP